MPKANIWVQKYFTTGVGNGLIDVINSTETHIATDQLSHVPPGDYTSLWIFSLDRLYSTSAFLMDMAYKRKDPIWIDCGNSSITDKQLAALPINLTKRVSIIRNGDIQKALENL